MAVLLSATEGEVSFVVSCCNFEHEGRTAVTTFCSCLPVSVLSKVSVLKLGGKYFSSEIDILIGVD